MNEDFLEKRIIHSLFKITLFVKGINGIWEVIVGVLFLFFKTAYIDKLLIAITGGFIVRHTGHVASNYLIRQAHAFSPSTKYFIAIYFLFYGIINIFLVIFLLKDKLWVYPAAIIFFMLFIVYQVYRLWLHQSGLLLFFTVFDIFLVILTWLEYKRIKSQIQNVTPVND